MKIKIQITVESDKGQPEVVQEVAHLDRFILQPETPRADAGRSAIDSRWDRANSGEHFKPGATRPSSEFASPVQFPFPDTTERRSPGVGH